MAKRTNLPPTASVSFPAEGGRLFAPSAERNVDAIVAFVKGIAPAGTGSALELASGTGQHIVRLAAAIPDLQWQPTEIDAERRVSIDAHAADAGLANILPALPLEATVEGWHVKHKNKSLIMLSNLLHLISASEARILVEEAAQSLAPGGILMVYGPFMRDDALTSDGDVTFHTSLVDRDPDIGYKNDFDVVEWGLGAWLEFSDMIEMPANNLAIVWRKPA